MGWQRFGPLQNSEFAAGFPREDRGIEAEELTTPPVAGCALLVQSGEPVLPEHGFHVARRSLGKGIVTEERENVLALLSARLNASLRLIGCEVEDLSVQLLRQGQVIQTKHVNAGLAQVISGYYNYFAVPTNGHALAAFRYHIIALWRRTLRRRSQKDDTTWKRIFQLADDWLPKKCLISTPGLTSVSPSNTRGGSRMRESRPYGSVRGALSNERPYRDLLFLQKKY